ncbi:MAG: Hsp70 family protein [Blautia sp.]|nr:Hsp70 family protein [Blautia sp.]
MNEKKLAVHNDLCLGMDLGTTNSAAATINVSSGGRIISKIVELPRPVDMYNAPTGDVRLTTARKPTLPSFVYYRSERNYEPVVGDFAKMQYPLRPHEVAKSIKSQMGKPLAEGFSEGVPDKTPASISARIIEHMLRGVSMAYRCQITEAVITVPANFDSAMCRATRDAAEQAGIRVYNEDGSERPVLLSEPNAVIYDLVNQIRNGEISDRILDLSSRKLVLVFDLGGGTLDITLHELQRREGKEDILKVDEIATNRYTLLGGDDFDEEIAKVMFDRYLKQYASHPEVVRILRERKDTVFSQLRNYAENLKLDVSEQCSDMSGWNSGTGSGWDDEGSGWDDEEPSFDVGGNINSTGYAYDDSFTKEEVETILKKFMGEEFSYEDYKKIESVENTRNIIYPILDVLHKASLKFGTDDFKVDAVILNGGMSKFYMVTDRVRRFFGFDPIVALDPDLSVARGAAVYHYYLRKYEELQDNMKLIGEGKQEPAASAGQKTSPESLTDHVPPSAASDHGLHIEWGSRILNDSLYLGVKNGGVHELIPTGSKLPYESDLMKGFRIEPRQNRIVVSIKSRNLDNTYRTISSGNITFNNNYVSGAYVVFTINMGISKVLTMNAWTCKDVDGKEKIEKGQAVISIDNETRTAKGPAVLPPPGTVLDPKGEINNFLQLCHNLHGAKSKYQKTALSKRIAEAQNVICNAQNKKDFALYVLDALGKNLPEEARSRLFVIARRLGTTWTEAQKRRLARICLDQLGSALLNWEQGTGLKVSTNINAIHTLSICGTEDDISRLNILHSQSRYLHACLYTHGNSRTELRWIRSRLQEDVRLLKKGKKSYIQNSAHAIGLAMRNDGACKASAKEIETTVNLLCEALDTRVVSKEELVCIFISLGCICDQRSCKGNVEEEVVRKALLKIQEVYDTFPPSELVYAEKSFHVSCKMISGTALNQDEEEFLLTKLEDI